MSTITFFAFASPIVVTGVVLCLGWWANRH